MISPALNACIGVAEKIRALDDAPDTWDQEILDILLPAIQEEGYCPACYHAAATCTCERLDHCSD